MIACKTIRVQKEFDLRGIDELLRCLIVGFSDWVYQKHRIVTIPTCIIRNLVENEDANGHIQSKHLGEYNSFIDKVQSWAIDLRSWHMTDPILEYAMLYFVQFGDQFTAIVEKRGERGEHIHIQRNR